MDGSRISRCRGNTPLRHEPPDYHPPGSERWLELSEGPDAGKKLFFYDTAFGDGDPTQTVVLVHGNPESSYTYRGVVQALAELRTGSVRVVAMDHIGFGLSDQASYQMVEMHHARNLGQLIRTLDLRNVTLVVHDWGGPIGIGAFLDEPERVSHLVVLNSTVFPIPKAGMTYENYPIPRPFSWRDLGALIPTRLWGIHAAYAVSATPRSPAALLLRYAVFQLAHVLGLRRLKPSDPRTVWRDQFGSRANALSSKRMVRQTGVWGHGYVYRDPRLGLQDNRAFYRFIQERIGPSWGPKGRNIGACGLFGAWDPLAKPTVLAQWQQALPQMRGHIKVFDGVSHFVEEHCPREIAEAIVALGQSPRTRAALAG